MLVSAGAIACAVGAPSSPMASPTSGDATTTAEALPAA
jgi:hypothetical protein